MRRSVLLYMGRAGSSCSCDHVRREEGRDGVDGDVLEALRLAGREECERDRLVEEEGGDDGGWDGAAGAKERLSTESR